MNVLHGRKAFQTFLQSQRAQIGAAPILLIESKPLNDAKVKHVDEACRWARFLFQQQMGLPTVVYHSQHSFPTSADQQQASEMAARVGAATVAAVGSGSAMDLAKSMSSYDHLILMPATPAAILAAGSSHSLFYDLAEETLIPKERQCNGTVALMHSKTDPSLLQEAMYACLAIALDSMFHGNSSESTHLDESMRMIRETPSRIEDAEDLLLRSGQALRYGLDENSRSIPLTILTSLITTELSAYSSMGIMASTVPALVDVLHDKHPFDDKEMLGAAPRAITTASIDSLLAHIRDNQGATGCYDDSDNILRTILQYHTVSS